MILNHQDCVCRINRRRSISLLNRIRESCDATQQLLIDARIKHLEELQVRRENRERLINVEALSRSAWSKLGRTVVDTCEPFGQKHYRWSGWYDVFTYEQTRPKIARRELPAVPRDIDTPSGLLAAIFRVNRSAKRFRDAAQTLYASRKYVFATIYRQLKQDLYTLKQTGIQYAYDKGWLNAEYLHGGLCVYRGNGYCFHSPLVPSGMNLPIVEGVAYSEAEPRGAGEMKLKDAVATIQEIDSSTIRTQFDSLTIPRRRVREPQRSERDYDNFDPNLNEIGELDY